MAESNRSVQPQRSRWVGMLGNLMLLAVSITLALGLGEVATRLLRPQQPREVGQMYQPDSTLGFVRLPGLDRRINAGEGWVTLRTDQFGERVGKAGRVESDTRLLVLGDSFMEARAVEFEESVPGRLQVLLSQALQAPVAVRNNGVSGYGVDHYRLSGARALARERFDAVLVSIFVGNDITDRPHESFPPLRMQAKPRVRLPKRWTWQGLADAMIKPAMLRLVGSSQLAALVWAQTETIRPRIGLSEWDFPQEILREHAPGPQWAVTASICARLATMADSSGVHALFVILPQYAQMEPASIAPYASSYGYDPKDVDVDQPNRLLLAAMQAQHLDVIDALESLRQAHRGGTRVYGRVDHHLSPEGHRVVADLVAPRLAQVMRASAARRSEHRAS